MRETYSQIRHMVAEQLKASPEYQKIKAKRDRESRSKKLRRAIIGKDLSALAKGITEGVLPIVLNSLSGEVLKEGVDLKALVRKLRQEIYDKVLATISDLEAAKKGKYGAGI